MSKLERVEYFEINDNQNIGKFWIEERKEGGYGSYWI
jgi:hypothetical protein